MRPPIFDQMSEERRSRNIQLSIASCISIALSLLLFGAELFVFVGDYSISGGFKNVWVWINLGLMVLSGVATFIGIRAVRSKRYGTAILFPIVAVGAYFLAHATIK